MYITISLISNTTLSTISLISNTARPTESSSNYKSNFYKVSFLKYTSDYKSNFEIRYFGKPNFEDFA